jgi:23S rRNA (adenine-N6)-dimethyltransferase
VYRLRQKLYSQNFLINRKLVTSLLGKSSIGKNDLVLEIGPGKGIITEQLLINSREVIAVEIDTYWYRYLKEKFRYSALFRLYRQDFLQYVLPNEPYKIFANIPFSIEGKIIRKLLSAQNPPEDCYLVVMKEPAYRWSALNRENLFSLMYKPWFSFSIIYSFRRSDFSPRPNVDAVMLRFMKRQEPLIQWEKKDKYQEFISLGFQLGRPVFQNLKKRYPKKILIDSFLKLSLSRQIRPGSLTLNQWLSLYQSLEIVN